MSYSRKITFVCMAYSLLLTFVYSFVVWLMLFVTEYQLYEYFLYHYTSELAQEYDDLINQIKLFFITLLIIVSFIIIFLTKILALLLNRQISIPIEHLTMAIKNLSIGTKNICSQGYSSELKVLANSFNEAIQHIRMLLKREKSFTESVSHELKSPLMIIEANLAILRADQGDLIIVDRTTDRMSRAVKSMNSLIDIFLVLARHDKLLIKKEFFNPTIIIESVFELFENQIIRWVIQCQQGTKINAPIEVFKLLLTNIVENANKYAKETAIIVINNHSLETYNQIKQNVNISNSSQLGINIIGRICYALGWQMTHTISHSKFFLSIKFYEKPSSLIR